MKYIKMYADQAAYDADKEKEYPHVGYIEGSDTVIYMEEKTDWSNDYLTFEALEDGTFKFNKTNITSLYYSLDGGDTWTELGSMVDTPTVNAGQTILFKGLSTGGSSDGPGRFYSTGNFKAMGNAYSMLWGDNFSGHTTFDIQHGLRSLFESCTKLVSAKYVVLQATAISAKRNAYYRMFKGCTSLVDAPELPATTLNNYCYQQMFEGCTSLVKAPSKLPATTLSGAEQYNSMFKGCTSLTTAPELPAATLAVGCYQNMFSGCTSLNYIKMLATNISASGCINSWVDGVAQSGTFVKNASMSSLPTGNSGIPTGWTVVDAS